MSEAPEPGPVWVWQEYDPKRGGWGAIAAIVPGVEQMGVIPLFTRNEQIARERYATIAAARAALTGLPTRLHRFDFSGDTTDYRDAVRDA